MEIANSVRGLRRQVAGFSLAMLIASFFAVNVAQAATFTDVQPADWFYTYVEQLAADGILNTSFSNYRPADLANRAEAAKLLVEAFDFPLENPEAETFKDVKKGTWYYTYVETAAKNGLVGGYKDTNGVLTGYFGPGDNVTREQYAKIGVLAAPLATNTKGGPHFPDVAPSMWSYEFVETSYNWSVIDGYPDGMFRPGNNINRAEIAKMTVGYMNPMLRPGAGFNVDDASAMSLTSIEVCFSEEVGAAGEVAANYMILDADGETLSVTDAEITADPMCVELTTETQVAGKNYELTVNAAVMSESGEEIEVSDVSFTGFLASGTGGDLNCTEGEQPEGVSVPKGATGVPFTVVNCQAAGDPVVISAMSFHRFGAGDEQDLADVYLYDGEFRLTTGRSVNSETQMVEFTGLNLELSANESVSLWVIADIAATAEAASQHGFELLNADGVESNASGIEGDFPVQGNLMTISGATAGTVTIDKNGSLDELTIGEVGRVAQFQLEASGTEAMELERIALYVRGTCDSSDVSDLKLYAGAEVLAETDGVGSKDLATFVLEDPFVLDQGDSQIFYVEAKNTCRNDETIKIYLDESTDLHVTGTTFGTGVTVAFGGYDGGDPDDTEGTADDEYSLITVKGSDFTVAFNGPDAGDMAVGQDEASCMDMTITNASGENVEIEDWVVRVAILGGNVTVDDNDLISDAPDEGNYTNFKLVRRNEDGTIAGSLLGPSELPSVADADDITQDVTLEGTNTIDAGESIDASVVFDVANNAAMDDDQIRCTLLDLTDLERVKDSNGDALGANAITPSTDISGNVFTISDSGLTFEVSNDPSSRTYVSGTNNAELVGFTVRSGSSLSNTIESLTVQGYVDCDVDATEGFAADGTADDTSECLASAVEVDTVLKDTVDTLALYIGDTKVSDFENVNAADGKIVFNNLNITVPVSSSVNLTLEGHINNSAPYGAANDRIKFAIAAATDVIATDSNGNNVDAGSISVVEADNGGAADVADDTVMTITSGGVGTTTEQGSPSTSLMVGNSADTLLAKYKFTSDDEDVTLRDINLGLLDVDRASLEYIRLYTDASCATPVKLQGGADSGQYTANGTTGVFQIEGLDLDILDAGDSYLCVLGATRSVTGGGEPTSGDNVGVTMLSITEIIGGSGVNVSQNYVSTATIEELDEDLDAVEVVIDTNDDVVFFSGQVIVIDQEMMLVVADGGNDVTVIRGIARTTAATHNVDDADGGDDGTTVIGLSTIGVGADADNSDGTGDLIAAVAAVDVTIDVTATAGFHEGDIVLMTNTAETLVEYLLVTGIVDADTLSVDRAMFGSTALANDHADANDDLGLLTEHGPLNPLRASKPVITNVVIAGGDVGAGTYTLLKFDIEAVGENDVTFLQDDDDTYDVGDSLISIQLTGTADAGDIDLCTLRNVTNNEVLDVLDADGVVLQAAGPDDLDFNFFDNDLTISPGPANKKTIELQCDLLLTGAAGDSVSARILEAADTGVDDQVDDADDDEDDTVTEPSVIVYSDGEDTTVDESGALIDNLPLFGPSFNSLP